MYTLLQWFGSWKFAGFRWGKFLKLGVLKHGQCVKKLNYLHRSIKKIYNVTSFPWYRTSLNPTICCVFLIWLLDNCKQQFGSLVCFLLLIWSFLTNFLLRHGIVVFRSKIRLCADIKVTQYRIRINSRGSIQFKIVSKFRNDKYYFYYLVYTNHQNRYGLKGDWNFGMGFCRCNTLKILGAVILSRKLSVQRALLIPKKLTWWSWPPWKVLGFFENKKNWLKN